jgi:mono/diheme cytochrome c family protein
MRLMKRIGYALSGLVGLVVVAVAAAYGLSEMRFRRVYTVPPEQITVSDDSATLARGAHLAATVGCADCHGQGLRGNAFIDAAPMGRLVALNLTKGEGGVGAQLTPELIERAVRHGISPTGQALRIMPSQDYQYMSDDDLRAIVSYVQHVQPANNVLAPSRLMLLPRALLVLGALPLLPAEGLRDSAAKPMSVAPGGSKEYGLYMATLAGCRACHGPGLSGGKIEAGDPSWGPAANLTLSGNLGKWSEAEFVHTIRTGKRPDGSPLREPMPWKTIANMSDEELHAIWLYLQSVPPRPYGTH